jgi:hypothetical protein
MMKWRCSAKSQDQPARNIPHIKEYFLHSKRIGNKKSHARPASRVAFRLKPDSFIGFDCTALPHGCEMNFAVERGKCAQVI